MKVKRGDVWEVLQGPQEGPPPTTLPCVVVSPPELHDFLGTVTVAPLVTTHQPTPFRVAAAVGGRKGVILLDQLCTLDKARLVRRVGNVGPAVLRASLAVLREAFA